MNTTITKLGAVLLFFCSFLSISFAQNYMTVTENAQYYGGSLGYAVDLVVPDDIAQYDVINFFIRGGDGGRARAGDCRSWGGDGAVVNYTVFIGQQANHIKPGTKLRLIPGQEGYSSDGSASNFRSSGGGGGSGLMAYIDGQWEILAVAGGGGGAYQGNFLGACIDSQGGQGGRAGTSGGNGEGDLAGDGGSNGQGGTGGGDIGDGDLSGGGGGVFADGSGGGCLEGKAGFPGGDNGGCDGNIVSPGGWGFGGGGSGNEGGGGGGGYSGGGGGGLVNNGGGGGSYANSTYGYKSTITAGPSDIDQLTYEGGVSYWFGQSCHPILEGVEVIEDICVIGDQATVKVDWRTRYTNCEEDPFKIVFHSVESNVDFDGSPDGINTNIDAGNYIIKLIRKDDGFLFDRYYLSLNIQDTETPVAKCKDANVQLENGTYSGADLVDLIDDGSVDNCSGVTLSTEPANFYCDDVGENTVYLFVFDENGNGDFCTANVTIEASSSSGPVALCKPAFTLEIATSDKAVPSIDDGSYFIECSAHSISWSPQNLYCDNVGPNIITLTITDDAGTTATCSTVVTLEDVNIPGVFCKSESAIEPFILDQNGTASIDYEDIMNFATDPCSGSNLTYGISHTSFDCSDVGEVEVTVYATDESGNTGNCVRTVTVVDPVGPSAVCEDVTVSLAQGGSTLIAVNPLDGGSSALCGYTPSASQTTFTCDDIGEVNVVLTITDLAGATSTCNATVTVQDVLPPTATCQDITVGLDNNGSAAIDMDDVTTKISDNCMVANTQLTGTTTFSCSDIGQHTITVSLTDNSGLSATCSATVTIQDDQAPVALCQDLTLQLDNNGAASITAQEVDDGSDDACGIQTLALNQSNFDCDAGSYAVTLTVTDNNGNTNDCTAAVTVLDNITPTAVCNDITINLVDRNAYDLTTAEVDAIALGSNDNCSWTPTITNGSTSYDCDDKDMEFLLVLTVTDDNNNSNTCHAIVRIEDPNSVCNDPPTAVCQNITVEVDGNCETSITASQIDNGSSDPDLDELTYSLDSEGPFGPGTYSVILTVADAEYTSTCAATVTAEDNTNPVAVCHNPTITFNGESSIDLAISDIWDEAAFSDNCDQFFFVGQDVTQVSCAQIGQTVPVLVTIEDSFGNESTCTANVTVNGLPCNWAVDPGGLGCDPAEANYDVNNDAFTLTSDGCYDPGYYRQNDAQGFVQQTLCGDGQIMALVTGVIGNGWAGISMRESNDPSAPMIQLMVDGVSMSKRELRQTYGSYVFAHAYPTQGKNWLRISRSGNQFTASRSADGVTWDHVFITQIPMNDCILIGLITMNGATSGEVTGVYENVSVTGSNALVAPGTVDIAQEQVNNLDFQIYPNPTTDEVTLQLDQFIAKEVTLRLYNHYGQAVWQQSLGEVQYRTERLNLGQFAPGTYLVELQSSSERVTKRVIIVSRN